MERIRHTIKTILLWVCVIILIPIISEFFIKLAEESGIYNQPSEKLKNVISYTSYLTSISWFSQFSVGIAGLTAGVWFDYLFRHIFYKKDDGKKISVRPDTRIKLRRDPAGTKNYLHAGDSNITSWQQLCFSIDSHENNKNLLHYDTLILTFDTEIKYERPVIETYGHRIPDYQVFYVGTKCCVFQFMGSITAPILEIWFPPIGYYAKMTTGE